MLPFDDHHVNLSYHETYNHTTGLKYQMFILIFKTFMMSSIQLKLYRKRLSVTHTHIMQPNRNNFQCNNCATIITLNQHKFHFDTLAIGTNHTHTLLVRIPEQISSLVDEIAASWRRSSVKRSLNA